MWETSIDHTIVAKEENQISSKAFVRAKAEDWRLFKAEIFVPLIGYIIDFWNRNNICTTSKFYTASRGCLASCYLLKAKYTTELKSDREFRQPKILQFIKSRNQVSLTESPPTDPRLNEWNTLSKILSSRFSLSRHIKASQENKVYCYRYFFSIK